MLTFSVNRNVNDIIHPGAFVESVPTSHYGRLWLSEAWLNALRGRVNLYNLNLDAYGFSCERYTRIVTASRETPLVTVDEVEEGVRGVPEAVASCIDQDIEDFIERSEIISKVNEFIEIHDRLAIEEGVNIWTLINLAKKGNQRLVNRLREIIQKYNLEELFMYVMRNEMCLSKIREVLIA